MTKHNSVKDGMKNGLLSIFDDHNEELHQRVAAGEVAKSTLTKYMTIRKKVASYILEEFKKEDLAVTKIRKSFCDEFHSYLIELEGLKHNTAVTYIEMLAKIFRVAVDTDLMPRDVFKYYSHIKSKKSNLDYLSSDELHRIEGINFQTGIQKQVRDLFLFSCYTGLSYEELKRASIRDIASQENGLQWLFAKRGKSWDERVTPLLADAVYIIEQYKEMRESECSQKIFPFPFPNSTKEALIDLGRKAGIDRKFDFTIARYTFSLTYAVEYELPTELMSSILGGNLVEKTDQYQDKLSLEVITAMRKLNNRLGTEEAFRTN